jgi:hypothetical protein
MLPQYRGQAHAPSGDRAQGDPAVSDPRVCNEIDRPSWQPGSHPHGLTPITLPAASSLPFVAIGAP